MVVGGARPGKERRRSLTLMVTSAAFVLWHVPFVFLSGEFAFGTAQIPLFFVNADACSA